MRDVAKDVESYHDFDNLLNGLASKGFSLAERQEDFSLHFEACKIMLPRFFTSNHWNYARYRNVQLKSLQNLTNTVLTLFLEEKHDVCLQDSL